MAYSIMLDAGHGGQDPGAVYKGRQEKNDNLKLALAVGEILKNKGIDISYTRTGDVYQTPFEKAQLANQAGVDYFISFHRNSSPKENQYNGAEVLIYDKSGIKYQMAENILVVDDEREIADLVEVYLQNEGYTVYKFYNAGDALNCLETTPISLAVLDIMLPDMDGFALCRRIRQKFYFPIIMLTAKVEDLDKIMGLTVGADDYITKPFNPLELTARVKTQLRRYTRYNTVGFAGEQDEEIDIRGMHISKASHKCTLNGQEVAFTPLEFDIVWYLAKRQGNVVSSEELFEAVWKEKYLDNNNTVMAHIARIRDKMHEMPRKPKFIKTVWGVGYTIE